MCFPNLRRPQASTQWRLQAPAPRPAGCAPALQAANSAQAPLLAWMMPVSCTVSSCQSISISTTWLTAGRREVTMEAVNDAAAAG